MKPFASGYFLITLLLTEALVAQANPLSSQFSSQSPQKVAQVSSSPNQDLRSFFETGRLRSEDRLLFQKPPTGVIPVREQSQSWQFVIFKPGNCSFWMPPGVLTQEAVTLDTSLGQLGFRTLASNTDDRRYVAAYSDALREEQVQNPQVLLAAIRDRAAPPTQFKLIEERAVTLDSHPGRELRFEDEEEAIVMRAYLVGNRVYALGVRYPKAKPEPRATRAFLNALQLLENP